VIAHAGRWQRRPLPSPALDRAVASLGGDEADAAADVDMGASWLFRTRYAALVQVAKLLVDDTGTAEEVVQEAFVRLYSGWRRLRDPGRADAYLRSTVWNLARDRLRRRRTVRRHEAGAIRIVAAHNPGPAEILLEDERRRAVSEALDRLPGRQRECLVLRYWADLSDREVASTLGISTGSVKRHVHRAMARLAAELGAP
jgi:RNA polymerase sigma-70 factor (sigma-E family)